MDAPVALHNVMIVMIVFGSMTAIVALALFLPLYFRAQKRRTIYQTVELFSARNQAVPPEIMESLVGEKSVPANDLRRGVILLSIALALALLGLLVDDARSPLIGVALFPGLIGVALIGLHFHATKRTA
jgi:hypothetical protein